MNGNKEEKEKQKQEENNATTIMDDDDEFNKDDQLKLSDDDEPQETKDNNTDDDDEEEGEDRPPKLKRDSIVEMLLDGPFSDDTKLDTESKDNVCKNKLMLTILHTSNPYLITNLTIFNVYIHTYTCYCAILE